MSLFANTLHRPAMRGGFSLLSAASLNSSIVKPSREACWSRNEPVPAAHSVFVAKSRTRTCPFSGSRSSRISFESSPPISITVRTSGVRAAVARLCAMISLMAGQPRISPASLPPEPVTATPRIASRGVRLSMSSSTRRIAWMGWPLVRT